MFPVFAAGQHVSVTKPMVNTSGNFETVHTTKVMSGIIVYLNIRIGIIIFLLRQASEKFLGFNVNPTQKAKNESIKCVRFFPHKKLFGMKIPRIEKIKKMVTIFFSINCIFMVLYIRFFCGYTNKFWKRCND